MAALCKAHSFSLHEISFRELNFTLFFLKKICHKIPRRHSENQEELWLSTIFAYLTKTNKKDGDKFQTNR
jgi:hypothetical protein